MRTEHCGLNQRIFQ